MYVSIDDGGTVSLADSDNLKQFSIQAADGVDVGAALGSIAEAAEDNHYWLDADAVIGLSGREADSDWVAGFWTMLEKVEKYGFSDVANRRVKAHVES